MGFTRQLSSLSLNGYLVQVKIGCLPQERLSPQTVRFDVKVSFERPPAGCLTDRLEDTVCYADLAAVIDEVSQKQEYALIEKLGWDCYLAIREKLGQGRSLEVTLTKLKPPIPNVTEGATFTIGDRL